MRLMLLIKSVALIVATCTNGIAIYSHFESEWIGVDIPNGTMTMRRIEPYRFCELPDHADKYCPPIVFEYFFLAIVMVSFIFSLVNLGVTIFAKAIYTSMVNIFHKIDVAYHIILAIVLIVGAVLYILDAVGIKNLDFDIPILERKMVDTYSSRIAASALAIVLSLIYASVSLKICGYK